MTTPFDSVGIEINWYQVAMFTSLARLLRDRHGSRLHLYVRGRVEENAYRKNNTDGLWDTVTNGSVHIPALWEEGLGEEEVIARARHTEELVGEPINRLALATRQTGHPSSPGA